MPTDGGALGAYEPDGHSGIEALAQALERRAMTLGPHELLGEVPAGSVAALRIIVYATPAGGVVAKCEAREPVDEELLPLLVAAAAATVAEMERRVGPLEGDSGRQA